MALSNKAKTYIEKHHSKKSASEIAGNLNLPEDEVRGYIDTIQEPLPLKKKILFYGITVSIPILFFVILEIVLRSVNYLGNTDLFVDPEIQTEEYYIPNPNFAARYFFYTNTIPNPSTDVFLQNKPDSAYRVFAMGGSSAAGYPYSFNGTFSRVVDDILTDAMPSREVEVVNVATSAISTYTLYDQVNEILEQKPDAIMIYAGHNEFYGALGVGSNENLGAFPGFVRFYLKLQRFKTFLFLRDVIVDSGIWLAKTFGSTENMADPGATLMERIISNQSIELNGPEYKLAMEQFSSNMEVIIERFEQENIPVYVSTIVSNIKDQRPFVSIENSDLPPAEEIYNQAVTFYQNGDTAEAKEQFEYAKDLDGLKFRAPSGINEIIRSLPASYSNVKLVESHRKFEEKSPAGIIGENLILEHLHPNQTGYYTIGRTFAETMLQDLSREGIASPDGLNLDSYYEKMYISEFDERAIWHRLKTLKQGFPFVTDRKPEPYQLKYTPQGFVDSLAFIHIHKDKRWDEAKVETAKYFESRGQVQKALLEYRGLIRHQPWNDSPYVFAARIYLDRNNFEEARPLLEKAYKLFPDEPYTTKMLGAIELNDGNTQRAIELLELSRELEPKDPQMLYNLSGAYGTNQEFQKALETANEVIAINPNFPGIRAWRQQLLRIINNSKQ